MKNKERIFLDYASITPINPAVEKEMQIVQKRFWANPSSIHEEGEKAKKNLEEARIRIARILHCRASEVFFTSGGTEGLNLAILGIIRSQHSIPNPSPNVFVPHIITSAIEHPAVLEPIKNLVKNREAEASFIFPDKNGRISFESIKKEMKKNTILVAIQHANNEMGAIQPIREISKVINLTPSPLSLSRRGGKKEKSPVLLIDACQSVLYEDVSLERLGADLLVLDGIKMYGPRGAGILVIKQGTNISPVILGGGQEGGLRSGTENVAAAAGLAKALEITVQKRKSESARLTKLRNYAINKILNKIPGASLNGGLENRLPNNINICFQNLSKERPLEQNSLGTPLGERNFDSEFLVIKLDTLGFAVSAASACHSLKLENASYVIENLGKKECASSSIRITLGRYTKKIHLNKFIIALKKIIH